MRLGTKPGEQLGNVAGYQTWGAAGECGWVPNLGSSRAMQLGTKPGE